MSIEAVGTLLVVAGVILAILGLVLVLLIARLARMRALLLPLRERCRRASRRPQTIQASGMSLWEAQDSVSPGCEMVIATTNTR